MPLQAPQWGTRFSAQFRCIDDACGARYPLDEVVYRCRECDELLSVEHDMEALGRVPAGTWRKIFDQRWRTTLWPHGSGIWGKHEWVCPEVEQRNIVSTFEGGSNLFWAERLGTEIGVPDLWLKLCGNSHTGSFKDLGMTVLVSMVKQMRAQGQDIPAVACASTGDTSAALAAYCAAADIPSVVLLPKGKVTAAQLIQPISNGAHVLTLDTDFDGCMQVVQELTRKHGIYLANSMNSLRIEGQKTVGLEIVQQFDWEVPDFVIIPGGNLGNVSALGAGFEMMFELGLVPRRPRIVCAQAQRANPLYLSYQNGFDEFHPVVAEPTAASAIRIGNPVSIRKAIRTLKRFDGIVTQASEQALAEAAARADLTGTFACPHTGVALAGLFQLIEEKVIGPEHRVVVISTAHGLKFTEFKTGYHTDALSGVQPEKPNVPVELPAKTDEVWAALAARIGR